MIRTIGTATDGLSGTYNVVRDRELQSRIDALSELVEMAGQRLALVYDYLLDEEAEQERRRAA